MMTEKKWRRFFKREMDKEMAEIEGILDEMNSNPDTKDVVAPEEMHDKLFARIREEEERRNRLTDEEKELIRLGTVYKKRRKWDKYLVLAAAVVCVLAIGITSFGGPAKIIERVQGIMKGKQLIISDTEDNRMDENVVASEAEAYQQIEDAFGFYPVRLDYLPKDMEFSSINLNKSMQTVCLDYIGENQETIVYVIYLNYRTGSVGRDVEDNLIEEYEKEANGICINVKKYLIEENQTFRYIAEFEYQDVYYVLRLNNIEEVKLEQILENLYFR